MYHMINWFSFLNERENFTDIEISDHTQGSSKCLNISNNENNIKINDDCTNNLTNVEILENSGKYIIYNKVNEQCLQNDQIWGSCDTAQEYDMNNYCWVGNTLKKLGDGETCDPIDSNKKYCITNCTNINDDSCIINKNDDNLICNYCGRDNLYINDECFMIDHDFPSHVRLKKNGRYLGHKEYPPSGDVYLQLVDTPTTLIFDKSQNLSIYNIKGKNSQKYYDYSTLLKQSIDNNEPIMYVLKQSVSNSSEYLAIYTNDNKTKCVIRQIGTNNVPIKYFAGDFFSDTIENITVVFDIEIPDVCQRGNYINAGVCTPCPVGKYQDEEGQSDCKNCQPGQYSTGTGNALCTPCPVGKYQDEEGQSDCKNCDGYTNLNKDACYEIVRQSEVFPNGINNQMYDFKMYITDDDNRYVNMYSQDNKLYAGTDHNLENGSHYITPFIPKNKRDNPDRYNLAKYDRTGDCWDDQASDHAKTSSDCSDRSDRNFVFYKDTMNNRFIIKNSEGGCHVRFDGDKIRFINNCEHSATKYPITITYRGPESSQPTASGRLGGRYLWS